MCECISKMQLIESTRSMFKCHLVALALQPVSLVNFILIVCFQFLWRQVQAETSLYLYNSRILLYQNDNLGDMC